MSFISKEMYVIKRKDTNEYMRNNGYFVDINDTTCKSAIKLYETIPNAKSAIRIYHNPEHQILSVKVTIDLKEGI